MCLGNPEALLEEVLYAEACECRMRHGLRSGAGFCSHPLQRASRSFFQPTPFPRAVARVIPISPHNPSRPCVEPWGVFGAVAGWTLVVRSGLHGPSAPGRSCSVPVCVGQVVLGRELLLNLGFGAAPV